MTKQLILLLAVAGLMFGADPAQYACKADTDVATTARAVTVQQAAGSGYITKALWGKVYCENACVVTTKRDGTAATATAGTMQPVNDGTGTATNKCWITSDVGAGTTVDTDLVAAGTTVYFDLSPYILDGTTTANNLTLSTDSISDRAILTIFVREEGR